MNSLLALFTYLVVMVLAPTALWATPRGSDLDSIVVRGLAVDMDQRRSSYSTSVISREQIESSKATNILELLRHIPGIHVDQSGGHGSISSVYVRSGDPNFAQILIDGVRVSDPTDSRGGSFDFSSLDISSIERIEIVRGPLSAAYGSDALSAVINIITRGAKFEDTFETSVLAGNGDYYRSSAHASSSNGNFQTALNVGGTKNKDLYQDSGEFENKSVNLKLRHNISNSDSVNFNLRFSDTRSKVFPDDSGGSEFSVLDSLEDRAKEDIDLSLSLELSPFSNWSSQLKSGYYRSDNEIISPGVAPGMRDPFGIPASITSSDFERYQLSLENSLEHNKWDLHFGFEFLREEGDTTGSLEIGSNTVPNNFELERDVWAYFVGAGFSLGNNFLLESALRFDSASGFQDEISPRVGLSYFLPKIASVFYASWGEGFKLPSFFALGNPLVGNPNLSSEESQSFEFGLRKELFDSRAGLNLAFFSMRFKDAIDFFEGPPPSLVNRSEIQSNGLELDAYIHFNQQITFRYFATYTDHDIKGTVEELRNRPKWRGGVSLNWAVREDLNFNLRNVIVGRVLDSSIPTGDIRLPSYSRTDVALSWRLRPELEVFCAIDNVFGFEYEEVIGSEAPGVRGRLGVVVGKN